MELLDWLPEEAKKALEAGTDWEEDNGMMDFHSIPDWCEDCKTWHRRNFKQKLVAREGKLYVWIEEFDEEGQWEGSDEYDYGSEELSEELEWLYSPWRWKEYWEEVLDTDEDTIHEVIVSRNADEPERTATIREVATKALEALDEGRD